MFGHGVQTINSNVIELKLSNTLFYYCGIKLTWISNIPALCYAAVFYQLF